MLDFNKIVHKLLQKKSKILLLSNLAELANPGEALVTPAVRKIAAQLVDRKILLRLRNGLYRIADRSINQDVYEFPSVDSILLSHYWEIIHAILFQEVGSLSKIVIAGPKSLEVHSYDFSPPRVLHVYADVDSVGIYHVSPTLTLRVKPIQSGGLTKKNLFPALKALSIVQAFPGSNPVSLRVLSLEAAILDALLKHDAGFYTYSVEKFIQRKPKLNREILGKLVTLRYISSINRLRELAQKEGLQDITSLCKEIIREEGGGCYLTSSLRKKNRWSLR